MNGAKNIITLAFPAVNMAEMVVKFSNRSRRNAKHFNPNTEMELRKSLLNRVAQSQLTLNAILNRTQIDLGDLLMLQPNDIIPLEMGIAENIKVEINNTPWYEAKVGTVNNRKALKLVELHKQQMR
jgi:flagellar motor switch protein FliM